MIVAGEEIFFVPYDHDVHKRLLYAPLRSFLGLVDEQVQLWFNQPDDSKSAADRELVLSRIRKRPRIDIRRLHELLAGVPPELSLALTDNCNLRCHYCHHAAGTVQKRGSMSRNMLDRLFEQFLARVTGPELHITFAGGGEPTFDLNLLTYATRSARNKASVKNVALSFRMATNGCYGQPVWDFITSNFADISLSFDGPQPIQDLHRPYAGGGGTFALVYATAKYLYHTKYPFAFRATVSDVSCEHLVEIVDFFATEFPGKSLGLEPLNPFGRAEVDTTVRPPDKVRFAQAMVEVFRFAQNKP